MTDACPEPFDPGEEYLRQNRDQQRKARRAELVKEFMLAEIASDSDATIEQILTRAVIDADAFLKWEEEQ